MVAHMEDNQITPILLLFQNYIRDVFKCAAPITPLLHCPGIISTIFLLQTSNSIYMQLVYDSSVYYGFCDQKSISCTPALRRTLAVSIGKIERACGEHEPKNICCTRKVVRRVHTCIILILIVISHQIKPYIVYMDEKPNILLYFFYCYNNRSQPGVVKSYYKINYILWCGGFFFLQAKAIYCIIQFYLNRL